MIDGLIDTLAAAAALVLCVSGAAKLRHPHAAATMIQRLVRGRGFGRRRAIGPVRAIGSGEIVVGLAVLVTGSRPAAALLAAAYLVFATVAVLLLRAGAARTSCGCFGNADSPLGPAHLVLNVVAFAAALAAVIRPPGPGCGLLDGGGTVAVTGSAQAVLLAALAYVAVTSLPALLAARRTLVAASPSTQEP